MARTPATAVVAARAALVGGLLALAAAALAQAAPDAGTPVIAPGTTDVAPGFAEATAAGVETGLPSVTGAGAAGTVSAPEPLSAAPVPTPPSGPTALPGAVLAYARALAAVEQAETPTSLEPLFEAGDAAQSSLMRIEGDRAWLERLSDADLAAARAAMRGFVLSSGDDIYALPDPAFFADLARRKGQPQDAAFFALTKQQAGENFLPLYLKDKLPTPCVRYGERIIGELYEGWRSYARQYPKAYRGVVKQNQKDLEETVVLGTCACGDTASVQAEQREFLRRFPKSPVGKDVAKRLKQLDVDPEVQPVNCR